MYDLIELNKRRKLQGITWEKLASGLPISGYALRIAFSRNSVDETYIEQIQKVLQERNEQSVLSEPQSNYNDSNKPPLSIYSDMEIVEYIARNKDRFAGMEALRLIINNARMDEIERKLDKLEGKK